VRIAPYLLVDALGEADLGGHRGVRGRALAVRADEGRGVLSRGHGLQLVDHRWVVHLRPPPCLSLGLWEGATW
jgi:hypothetical protein